MSQETKTTYEALHDIILKDVSIGKRSVSDLTDFHNARVAKLLADHEEEKSKKTQP